METEIAPDTEIAPLPATALSRIEFNRAQYFVDLVDIPGPRPDEATLLSASFWRRLGSRLYAGDEITVRRSPEPDLRLVVVHAFPEGGVEVARAEQAATPQEREHLVVCRVNATSRASYTVLTGIAGQAVWRNNWSGSSDLQSIVRQVLPRFAKGAVNMPELTVTNLDQTAVRGGGILSGPPDDDLGALLPIFRPAIQSHVLVPLGHADQPDMWTALGKHGGNLTPGGKFREPLLVNEILRFFAAHEPKQTGQVELWREFGNAHEARSELLVRPLWRACDLLPEHYPPLKPIVSAIDPTVLDQKQTRDASRQAKQAYREMMASKGYRWSDKTRSWKPPPKPE
jgi:hypothetical protein